ncbi:hypothetical protein HAX54_048994, partial [Datura stramonium]|nr:hypothetical protein [Datura stramonium]
VSRRSLLQMVTKDLLNAMLYTLRRFGPQHENMEFVEPVDLQAESSSNEEDNTSGNRTVIATQIVLEPLSTTGRIQLEH